MPPRKNIKDTFSIKNKTQTKRNSKSNRDSNEVRNSLKHYSNDETEDEIDFREEPIPVTDRIQDHSDNEELSGHVPVDEFVQENIDDFEEINTITNRMKELLEEIKELKTQRNEIESKLLNEILDLGHEEGVYKYKNIKLEYSIKKMIKIKNVKDKKNN